MIVSDLLFTNTVMSLPGCNKNHWQNSVKPNQPSKGEFFFFTLMEYSVCSVLISWWYMLYVAFCNTACLATMWRWVMMISLNKWPFSCWWQSSASSPARCCLTGVRDWISSTNHLAALWASHFLREWEMTLRNHEEQTLAPRPLCVCDLTLSCRYRTQPQTFLKHFHGSTERRVFKKDIRLVGWITQTQNFNSISLLKQYWQFTLFW